MQKKTLRKISIFATIGASLLTVSVATVATFTWFEMTARNVNYSNAQIVSSDSNLTIAIASHPNETIDEATQPSGVNHLTVPFNSYLMDTSYNGGATDPFYKVTWASNAIGESATAITPYALTSSTEAGFYLFQITLGNTGTNAIYVYLGDECSLTPVDEDYTPNNKAARCERIAIRSVTDNDDETGYNLSYWVPNREKDAADAQVKNVRMLANKNISGLKEWSNSSVAYDLPGYYIGSPDVNLTSSTFSPINENIPSSFISGGVKNIVHYGNFTEVNEDSTSCQEGQFICSIAGNSSVNINIIMWAEGTDPDCDIDALTGATKLKLEFTALTKQLWPSA